MRIGKLDISKEDNGIWFIYFKKKGPNAVFHIPKEITIIPDKKIKIDPTSDTPVNYQERYADFTHTNPDAEYARALAQLIADVESLTPYVKNILELYIEWLNQPEEGREYIYQEHPYEFDDLFRYTGTNERGTYWERHYETRVNIDTKFGDHRFVALSAGTADDGGPAYLYALIDESDEDNPYIVQITQEFDTMHSVVYFSTEGRGEGGIIPFGWGYREASGGDPQAK